MTFGNDQYQTQATAQQSWYKSVDWKTALVGGFMGSVFSMVTFNLFQRSIVKDELITTLAKYSDDDEELSRSVRNRICELRAEAGQEY